MLSRNDFILLVRVPRTPASYLSQINRNRNRNLSSNKEMEDLKKKKMLEIGKKKLLATFFFLPQEKYREKNVFIKYLE